jgi:hypothetical protein
MTYPTKTGQTFEYDPDSGASTPAVQNSDFSILSTSGAFAAAAATYKSLSFTAISNDCTLNATALPAGMTISMTPAGLVNNAQVFGGTQYTLIGEVLV